MKYCDQNRGEAALELLPSDSRLGVPLAPKGDRVAHCRVKSLQNGQHQVIPTVGG